MDENHSAGSEIQRFQYGRRSWLGSEPSTLEIDVYVRRYALLVVLARNDYDDDVVVAHNSSFSLVVVELEKISHRKDPKDLE